MNSATIILQVRRNIENCSFLVLSHEVSSYLHQKVLYSYPFLGIISILQCYKIDIKELSSRQKQKNNLPFLLIQYFNLIFMIIIQEYNKMGCAGSFQGFSQEEKQRMFADYSKAFNISGSEIVNEKKYLIQRMIRIKETIERYPLLCKQKCQLPCFPQVSYIPEKFNLCGNCQGHGVVFMEKKGYFKCAVCSDQDYDKISPFPCKNCRASGLIVEINPYRR